MKTNTTTKTASQFIAVFTVFVLLAFTAAVRPMATHLNQVLAQALTAVQGK